MASAVSIFLIAAGAILYFAVSKTVTGINLDTVGVIMMFAGAAGLVISLVMLGTERARGGRTTVVRDTTLAPQGSTTVTQGNAQPRPEGCSVSRDPCPNSLETGAPSSASVRESAYRGNQETRNYRRSRCISAPNGSRANSARPATSRRMSSTGSTGKRTTSSRPIDRHHNMF